jgi:hypothetical protein
VLPIRLAASTVAGLQSFQEHEQFICDRLGPLSALRTVALRRSDLQHSLLFAIRGCPYADQLDPDAGAKRLPNEPRAVALEVLPKPTRDMDRPSEVVLRTVDLAVEVQEVATLDTPHAA